MKEKILIIDGSSLFFRAFYALPLLKTKSGIYTNAIYGFIMMVENAIEKIKPKSLVVCFDMKGNTFRNEIYNEYKGNRQKTPVELNQQFPIVRDILKLMNIVYLEFAEFEADDIAGTVSLMADKNGYESYLLTGDKDYFQLVNENTKVLFTKKGITDLDVVSIESIKEKYGIDPIQFIEVKGLMGDNSDNIPGVPGVGEKTALKLIREYKDMNTLYENIDKIKGKLKEKLVDNKDQAFMSKELGTIKRDIYLGKDLEDFKLLEYNFEELSKLYRDYEFSSLLQRLPLEYQKEASSIISEDDLEYSLLNEDELLAKLNKSKNFAFKFITDGKVYEGILPTYIGFKIDNEEIVFYKIKNEDDVLILKEIFENPSIKKYGYSMKDDLIILLHFGIEINSFMHDIKIAEYILNATESKYDVNDISNKYLEVSYKDLDDLLGKGKNKVKFSDLSEADLFGYFSFLLSTVCGVYDIQAQAIKNQEMENLYYEVELPLVEILASMELVGVRMDAEILSQIGKDIDIKILELEKLIYLEAGEEFNINSPKKLGLILFEKLKYPVLKKTKTGYSTSADVLEKLRKDGDIISNVLEYRKLAKLKSTYIEGLKELINPSTGRIHSNFNQTITSTGRISSTNPNLQNIPIKTDEGKLIRKSFLASENHFLVDADYSQIELRVLASISEDENMIEAFKNNDDIHSKTASEVFGVSFENVDTKLRSRAKAVNFGIVYGISDYGLSQNLNISRKEAKEYIDNYLDHYNGIKLFMEKEILKAKERGFINTILNRRRYIPELNSKNFNIRSFGERIAINTPIQGSAADIIKIAMVKVYKELKNRGLQSKLILQIHDELVIDACFDEFELVKDIVKNTMENAVKLKVNLKVDMQTGSSLYETK